MTRVDNYIKYLKAFYDWEQQNHLTCIQECILMRILRRVNDSGWNEWVKISGFELINELRIPCKNTFVNNRNRLIELGLIEYKSGKKGKPSSYKLNMPERKQITYSFRGQEKGMVSIPNNIPKEEKGMTDIPNNIPKEEKGTISIPNNIPNSIPDFIPNKPQSSHEQWLPETPKHKTINNKLVNTDVFTYTYIEKGGCPDVMSDDQKYRDILALYNTICLDLSKVIKLSDNRKTQIDNMLALGYSFEDFKKVFENSQNSSFLCGKSGNCGWKANFDWLIEESNFLKVLEGNYSNFSVKDNLSRNKIETSMNVEDWI